MSQTTEPLVHARPTKPSTIPSDHRALRPSGDEAAIRARGGDSSEEEDAEPVEDTDVLDSQDLEPQVPETD